MSFARLLLLALLAGSSSARLVAGLPYVGVWFIQTQADRFDALETWNASLVMTLDDPTKSDQVRFYVSTPEGQIDVPWSAEDGRFRLPEIPPRLREQSTLEHNLEPGAVKLSCFYKFDMGPGAWKEDQPIGDLLRDMRRTAAEADPILRGIKRFFPDTPCLNFYVTGLRIANSEAMEGELVRLMRGDQLVREFRIGDEDAPQEMAFADYPPDRLKLMAVEEDAELSWNFTTWTGRCDETPPPDSFLLFSGE